MKEETRVAGAVPLGGYYLLHFATVGIILPFLPAWYRSLQLSRSQVGWLAAMSPLLILVAPPVWGRVADRSGRADRVLSIIALGAGLGFLPLLWARTFPALLATAVAYAFFVSSVPTMADSLTLRRVELVGGSYSRLRLFGSLGFVLSSTAFGLTVSAVDARAVWVPLALMFAAFGWSFSIRARSAPVDGISPLAGVGLLRQRDIALLLGCTALHWIASTPYHGFFAIHVGELGLPPSVVGVGAGLGVVAEIVVLYVYPSTFGRMPPRYVLSLSFAATGLRWLLMSFLGGGVALVLVQVLHGLTFGAFYTASVSALARRVPPHLRASGQALFAAVTFGVGGLIGYPAAGAGYDALGGHRLFAVAAALELLPLLLVLRVRPPPSPVVASA
jgi:MFS transporter, PPP family, 3-phenylpropionic acid transporter